MSEKYKPSEEEVGKAEGMMNKEQKAASREREFHIKKLEGIGRTGHLNFEHGDGNGPGGSPFHHKLVGEVDGHKIELAVGSPQPNPGDTFQHDHFVGKLKPENFAGSVDGQEISAVDARQLYEKYWASAGSDSSGFTKRAQEGLDRDTQAFQEQKRQERLSKGEPANVVEELLR